MEKKPCESAQRNWKKPSNKRIEEGSKHHNARKDERKSVRVASQPDGGGGGTQLSKFRSQRGAYDGGS